MKKKLVAILLIFTLALTACGKVNNKNKEDNGKEPINSNQELPNKGKLAIMVAPKEGPKSDPALSSLKNDVSDRKLIALTFDDGPSIYTPAILDAFKEVGGHGTFFLVGDRVEEYGDTVNREAEEGHDIGNHSYSHANLTKLSSSGLSEEIGKCSDIIMEVSGYTTTICRPTYGAKNDTVREFLKNNKMAGILWNIDTLDWKNRNRDTLYNTLMNDVSPGDIVLMHDLYESTKDGVTRAIKDLSAQGYEFVSVTELMDAYGIRLVDGEMYYSRRDN